jgi:hypothetical protein
MGGFEKNVKGVQAIMTAQGYVGYFNMLASAGAAGLVAPFHSAWEKIMLSAIVGRVGVETEEENTVLTDSAGGVANGASASSAESVHRTAAKEVPLMAPVPMVSMDGRCLLLCEEHAMLKQWHGGQKRWFRAPAHVNYVDEGDANEEGQAGSDQPTCSAATEAGATVRSTENHKQEERALHTIMESLKQQVIE